MLSVVCNAHGQLKNPVNIGLITDGLSQTESMAAKQYLDKEGISFISMAVKDIDKEGVENGEITSIWWIKNNEGITEEERNVGKSLKRFVDKGGNLILSMNAVKLLNEWGIEKNKFDIKEDSVVDEGFGRPLGFHGYRTHPIFAGLHGGAYIWKGKKDHVVKKIGFLGNNLPDTSICKVLGIGWSYITFHEDEKLLLEYKLGKGSIIAVGAYTYFSRPNLNQKTLYKFYKNIFNYMANNIKGIKERDWKYGKTEVLQTNLEPKPMSAVPATKWELPELSLTLKKKEGTNNFVNLTGRRMLLMGKERGGIDEIWTHPFMAFRDIHTAVRVENDSIVWLNEIIPEITVSPEMLIRKYKIGDDILNEMITVAFDKPLGVIHYEWTGRKIQKVYVKFTSNLRMMWPYSDSSSPLMSYQWDESANAVLVRNAHAGSESMIGFSMRPQQFELGRYDGFLNVSQRMGGVPTDLFQVSGLFSFDAITADHKFNIYLGGSDEAEDNVVKVYRDNMSILNNLYVRTSLYYKDLLVSSQMITTPDEEFNDGYQWALVRTDQFLQTTPGVGTSMMAGFGTTARGWNGRQKISGRPGYAWYFGRDGEWMAMALNAIGATRNTEQVLDLFVRYQAVNGKILHELTSSGTAHYDAADATPLFVILAGHYLRYSGNIDYIKKNWSAIKRAMDFCYSTDTDNDGLIENTNVGHGWIEGGPLFGTHTEFYLAGTWAAALDEASYMSKIIGHRKLAKQYASDASRVKRIIDSSFWSKSGRHFYNGKMLDGSFMTDATVLQSVPILLGVVTDNQKAVEAASVFSEDNFSTDWGVRMIPNDNPKFNPNSYHAGMVWPLFTGFASLAEYKTGYYKSGFTHMMNNISGYHSWSLGSIVETLNGDVFKPNGVCYLQGWSETMCLQPAIEGMIGLKPDAIDNSLQLSPYFPTEWKYSDVKNIKVGKGVIHLKMERYEELTKYIINSNETVSINFKPILPSNISVKSVKVNGKEVPWNILQKPQGQMLVIGRTLFGVKKNKIEIETID